MSFKKYHEQNPKTYQLLLKYAKEAKRRGFEKFSVYTLFEIIKWDLNPQSDSKFGVSNSFKPDYARKLMRENPKFKGFFNTRPLKNTKR